MKVALRTAGVALASHLALSVLSFITATATEVELRARGVDPLDATSLLEMFVRDGLWTPAIRVSFAGLVAALCLTPLLEAALASAATGARSIRSAFEAGAQLTPASLGVSASLALVLVAALALASIPPLSAYALTDDLHDERARLLWIGLAALPAVVAVLAYGVAVDVGRVHLARGVPVREAFLRGLRAVPSPLFPAYALVLAVGLSGSFAHAWLGRTNDASSLVAGGVVLVVSRPLSRAAFMLLASRRERGR